MKTQNGISLIALVVTIIVIIILAAISITINYDTFNMMDKTTYYARVRGLEERLNIYHESAELELDNYRKDKLSWDGTSERAENTGKVEDGINEDTPIFIFKEIPEYFEGKIYIQNGELGVKDYTDQEMKWLDELQIKHK